jgi:hypothetical protein
MPIDLDDPIALMLAATEAFGAAGLDAAAYGGLVLAMYGEARETRDADLAIATVDPEVARDALGRIGVTVVIAFRDVVFGGCAVTRLSLVDGGRLNTVALVRPRSTRYAAAVLERALHGSLRGRELRVCTPEDFVILKLLATRDRDLDDAKTVLEQQRDRLDLALVAREIALLSNEIPQHDVRARWAAIDAHASSSS